MEAPKKRHLYFDQQQPFEEPLDAEHATVTPSAFARRPPTNEDEYFMRLSRGEQAKEPPPVRRYPGRPVEPPADMPDSIWQRIFRAFSKRFDTEWKP